MSSATPQSPTAEKQPMKQRSVVSCFIFKYDEGLDPERRHDAVPKVALFRRSEKVRTYRHQLAPISGNIDPSDATPLAAAYRELREEITLTERSLRLYRQGKPYSFSDASIGRKWDIYPFAFLLMSEEEGGKGEAGIQIDWEHEGWGWYEPGSVVDGEEFGGVPKLKESLRRVWFEGEMGEAGRQLAKGLNVLREDHERGARYLAHDALVYLRYVIEAGVDEERGDALQVNEWWSTVRMTGWHLWKNGRESMGAAILSVVITALDAIESLIQNSQHFTAQLKERVVDELNTLAANRESTTSRVSDALLAYLSSRNQTESQSTISILTLSNSSTINFALLRVLGSLKHSNRSLDIRILESRPLYEGVTMASSLLKSLGTVRPLSNDSVRPSISVHTDASAAHASKGLDVVLIGADRISAAGDVSNKTGSLAAVLCAKHVSPKVQVVVLSELEKVAGPGATDEHVIEENDAAEVMRAWEEANVAGGAKVLESLGTYSDENKRVEVGVRNVYFEWVPRDLIDVYVCEDGVLGAEGIRERSDWVGAGVERMFGDL